MKVEELASVTGQAILDNLLDRRGIKQALYEIDADVMDELRQTIGEIALAAAGYVVERGWQPIETAPKDGTRLLCFAPAAEDRASLVRSDFWWVRERAFAHMRPGQPYTHWRPLPAAPEARDDGR